MGPWPDWLMTVWTAQIRWNQIFSDQIETFICGYKYRFFEIWPQSDQVEHLYWNSSLQHARLMFIKTESQPNKQTKQGRQQRRPSVEGLWGYYVGWYICPRKNPGDPTATAPCLNAFSIKWPKGDTGERGCGGSGKLRGWMPNLKRLNASA